MDCSLAELRMAESLAGELRASDRDALARHLADCPACRAGFEAARDGFRADWPDAAPPRRAVDAVLAQAQARPAPVSLLRGLAAAAAVVLAALLIPVPRPEPAVVTPAVREPILAMVQPAALGALEARDEDGRPAGELGLLSHIVSVEILDGVALTTVEENFENHTDRRLEGTFRFPLPTDASISRLALEVNGKMEEGTCLERNRAREVFESIVRSMKDPALLEWQPGGIFSCRVFPIEPRATKRVLVAYTQALPFFRGTMTYTYPLASEKARAHPPGEVRIDVRVLVSGALDRIESTSHRVDVSRRDAREAKATFAARNLRPEKDFVLSMDMADDEIRVVAHKVDGEDGYFACLLTPRGGAARGPSKHVFLIDASASVSAPQLDAAQRVVLAMMERAIPGDRFEVVAHNLGLERSGEVDVAAAARFLEKIRTIGGCDLARVLREAPEGELIYVGQGVPTAGETEPERILEAGRQRRVRTVAIGSDANLGLLEKLGPMARISPSDDVPRRAAEIAATLGEPGVSSIQIRGGDAVYGVSGVRDVFFGERLVAAGRYRGPVDKLIVDGRGWRREVPVVLPAKEEGNSWVRRLWAQRRVADLLAAGGAAEEVTGLGVKHQIMTPYTSFLVLETEQMWKDHQLQREVQKTDALMSKGKPAVSEAAASESSTKREVTRRMADLLTLTYEAAGEGRYVRGIRLCDEVLLIDPHYVVAKELKEEMQKAQHREGGISPVVVRKLEDWKLRTGAGDEPVVPDAQNVRIPSRDEWAEISKRVPESVLRVHNDAEALAIHRKLGTMKIDLAFENAKLDDIVAVIRDYSGLNIVMDARVRDKIEPDRPVTFKARDEEVGKALARLLAPHGLVYDVMTEESVVLLREPRPARTDLPPAAVTLVKPPPPPPPAPRAGPDDARNEFRVRVEQAQIDITKHVRDAERYLNAKMYEQAAREFENAEFKITNIPYDVQAMSDLLPLVKESLVRTRNARMLTGARFKEDLWRISEAEAGGLHFPDGSIPRLDDTPMKGFLFASTTHVTAPGAPITDPLPIVADQSVFVRQIEVELAQMQELSTSIEERRSKLAKSLSEKSLAVSELQSARLPGERLSQDLAELERKHVALARDRKVLEEKVNAIHLSAGANTAVAPRKALEAKVTAVAIEIGLVVISIGRDEGAREGDEFTIFRGGDFIAKVVIDRADRAWAAGKVVHKVADPRVGDDASNHIFVGSPYPAAVLRGERLIALGKVDAHGKFRADVELAPVREGDTLLRLYDPVAYFKSLPYAVQLDLESKRVNDAIRAKLRVVK